MDLDHILRIYKAAGNPAKAMQMKAYLRDQFEFFGINAPERKHLNKPFFANSKNEQGIDYDFVRDCYARPEREIHYFAMEYVFRKRKNLGPGDIQFIEKLIVTNSWWDTVDYIAANIVGWMVREYPQLKESKITEWMVDENMWLRRASIIYQLKYRGDTDIEILGSAIRLNLGSKEFFINKAIGWALRQYSRYDPEWVRSFLQNFDLQTLSKREASKYI